MNLRMKFFFLLLVFSIVPLIAVASFGKHGIRKLGRTISHDARTSLTKLACESLRQTAENSSKILLLSKQSLEFALFSMAHEAEQLLADAPPVPTHKVYFAENFDDKTSAPSDFAASPRYWMKTKEGRLLLKSISMNDPVFYTAPDTSKSAVKDDIARLSRLTPKFRNITREFKDNIYWMYVSLDNGLHVSYPGHGGYPKNYDPRQRPWYKRAKRHVDWVFPIVDATTGMVMFTASRRIYSPEGAPIGVVGLDVLITDLLQDNELSALWSSEMRSFFVASTQHPKTQKPGLLILAQKDYLEKTASWKRLIEFEWLTSENPVKFQKIITDLNEGKSGYVELPYKGVDSFWAYSAVAEGTHFLVIVPKSVVMTLPRLTDRTVKNITREQLQITAAHAMVVILLSIVAGFIISKRITRPITKIAQAAKQLSKGDFSVRLDMHTGDERDAVIDAFNEMVPKLEDHLRIYRSLNLATEVQQSLLPQATPDMPGLDIAGKSIYCDETGGDYYDYLGFEEHQPGSISVIIGDVADHGVPSALLMASARALIRQRSTFPGKIAEIVSDVNRQLTSDVDRSGQFMTLIYMTVDRDARRLQWVRAGHDPAILYDPHTDTFEELQGPGIAIGLDETWQYEENYRTNITTGQIILLGTDGIWEARNRDGKMFGKTAVYDVIRETSEKSAGHIINAIIDRLDGFQGEKNPEDDVTIVIVKIVDIIENG